MSAHPPVVELDNADWLDFGLADNCQCQVALVQGDIQVTVNSIEIQQYTPGRWSVSMNHKDYSRTTIAHSNIAYQQSSMDLEDKNPWGFSGNRVLTFLKK